jgi:hypothetical protein
MLRACRPEANLAGVDHHGLDPSKANVFHHPCHPVSPEIGRGVAVSNGDRLQDIILR